MPLVQRKLHVSWVLHEESHRSSTLFRPANPGKGVTSPFSSVDASRASCSTRGVSPPTPFRGRWLTTPGQDSQETLRTMSRVCRCCWERAPPDETLRVPAVFPDSCTSQTCEPVEILGITKVQEGFQDCEWHVWRENPVCRVHNRFSPNYRGSLEKSTVCLCS